MIAMALALAEQIMSERYIKYLDKNSTLLQWQLLYTRNIENNKNTHTILFHRMTKTVIINKLEIIIWLELSHFMTKRSHFFYIEFVATWRIKMNYW